MYSSGVDWQNLIENMWQHCASLNYMIALFQNGYFKPVSLRDFFRQQLFVFVFIVKFVTNTL